MRASATVEAQMKHSGGLVRVWLSVSSVLCPWLFSLLGSVSVLLFAREIVMLKRVVLAVLMSLVLAPVSSAADRNERLEFTTMVAHWAEYGDPDYLDFIAEAMPEVVQLGFYGAHFWGLAATPQYKGYPAHFPVQGHAECSEWFRQKTRAIQSHGSKVVGHMNVKFLVGDPDGPDGPRGFFKFYRDQWDTERLGPKPVDDPLTFLERQADGKLIVNNSYNIGGMKEYWACLNNPNWRKVLKAWTKHGIQQGVDGFIANYFYRHDCHCEHCVSGFKKHLRTNFSDDGLNRFGITNLDQHRFTEIVGWHKPEESTPLRREMLRWSQLANKQAFDDVFVEYGRSLKPDLIAAQWNHLGDFNQINGDERCMLPYNVWGQKEDYLWYSTGDAAHYTDLENGFLGEGTLQARYIRGAFDDKPFTLGKYESTRTRAAIAELAANGGAPMGFYTRFKDPEARKEIVRYYNFIRQQDDVIRANRPAGEVVLNFPRSKVHEGNVTAVARFKEIGKTLLDEHVLFDIIPDDLADTVTWQSKKRPRINPLDKDWRNALKDLPLSCFTAPTTVRVSATRPAKSEHQLTLHFVNYNRIEPPQKKSAGRGIADEQPIAVADIECDLPLQAGQQIAVAEFVSPEHPEPQRIEVSQTNSRAKLKLPKFLVYGVLKLELK